MDIGFIATAHAKSFPACYVFTNRSQITASNNGDSSASALRTTLNGGSLQTDSFLRLLASHNFLEPPNQSIPPITVLRPLTKKYTARLFHSPTTRHLLLLALAGQTTNYKPYLSTHSNTTTHSACCCSTDSARNGITVHGEPKWVHSTATGYVTPT
jgi:hypothetical protein